MIEIDPNLGLQLTIQIRDNDSKVNGIYEGG
jgi:hypothetical protein